MTAIITALISMLSAISVIWLKFYLDDKKTKKVFNPFKYTRKYKKIESILDEIRIKLSANRASLWEFHNGGKLYTGQSEQKISMKVESLDEDSISIILQSQRMPINIFTRYLSKLMYNDITYEMNEYQYNDVLSTINNMNSIHSSVIVKINSDFKTSEGVKLPIALLIFNFKYPIQINDNNKQFIISRLPIIKDIIYEIV